MSEREKFDASKMKQITPEEAERVIREMATENGNITINVECVEITEENAHLVYPHLRAGFN
jgi:hypothetical protein